MRKTKWKMFSIYDKLIASFFILNLFLDVINEKILDSFIPNEIVGYLFWLSLGLFLGFQLCKFEYKKSLKSIEKKEPQKKHDSSIEKKFDNTTGQN